jgi:hypothetical protein
MVRNSKDDCENEFITKIKFADNNKIMNLDLIEIEIILDK